MEVGCFHIFIVNLSVKTLFLRNFVGMSRIVTNAISLEEAQAYPTLINPVRIPDINLAAIILAIAQRQDIMIALRIRTEASRPRHH